MMSEIHPKGKEAIRVLQNAEVAFSGRSRSEGRAEDLPLSLIALFIGISSFVLYFYEGMQMPIEFEISRIDRVIYSIISSAFLAIVFWVVSLVILKRTFIQAPSSAILGICSSIICAFTVEAILGSLLLEMRWDIVWANRVLLAIGPDLTYAMTNSALPAENWRIWPFVTASWVLIGAFYGTSDIKTSIFLPSFLFVSIALIAFSTNSELANFDTDAMASRLTKIVLASVLTFSVTRWYRLTSQEFQVNRLRTFLMIGTFGTFFLLIFTLDPPEWFQSLAAYLSPVPIIGELLDPLTEPGTPPSTWGGLLVNFIVAAAGCVLGLFVGIMLAFCRQSNLPIIKWPSVLFIEVFRSGPLICWLYFALFMLGDVADPLFSSPEDFTNILRMMAIFTFFGGVYIAEVIRGGLQSVDSGQKEAAVALGLSPVQTKQFIELPNAIRTTMPSIVSVFIGLWKDTTLLYIIGVLDFLKIASTLPNTDFNFMGYYMEPLFFASIVFWLPAFYISRISMKVERSLGLVNEGGAERA